MASFLSTRLRTKQPNRVAFFVLEVTILRCEASHKCSGSNLKAKQGVGRAECTEAIDRDYATGAEVTKNGPPVCEANLDVLSLQGLCVH